MALSVRLATDGDMEAVGRLRYDVYVDEMGVRQKHADHRRRQLIEPLDETGEVLVASHGDELVGTARVNLGTKSDFTATSETADLADYGRLFRMAELAPYFPRQVSVRTKLAVRPAYRGSPVMARLLFAGFRLQVDAGIEFDLSDCRPERLPLFQRTGYRQIHPQIMHPDDGPHVPVILVVRDRSYLERVCPPMARLLPPSEEQSPAVRFFYDRFPHAPRGGHIPRGGRHVRDLA
jgi:hypothetical protein